MCTEKISIYIYRHEVSGDHGLEQIKLKKISLDITAHMLLKTDSREARQQNRNRLYVFPSATYSVTFTKLGVAIVQSQLNWLQSNKSHVLTAFINIHAHWYLKSWAR
jgi:hypothetical protein